MFSEVFSSRTSRRFRAGRIAATSQAAFRSALSVHRIEYASRALSTRPFQSVTSPEARVKTGDHIPEPLRVPDQEFEVLRMPLDHAGHCGREPDCQDPGRDANVHPDIEHRANFGGEGRRDLAFECR